MALISGSGTVKGKNVSTYVVPSAPGHIGRRVVDETSKQHVITVTATSAVFNALRKKEFNSVCPDGVEVSLTRGNEVLREKPWFEKLVINQLWLRELDMAHLWTKTLGYFVVSYEDTSDVYNEPVPHVLDPQLYILSWTTNANGVRTYYIQLRRGPGANQMFRLGALNSRYDIFILHPPSEDGQLRSDARTCLAELVDIDGIMRAFKIALANASSPPFILELLQEKYPSEDRTPRNCGTTAALDRTLEEEIGISGLKFGAIRDIVDTKKREEAEQSFAEASSRSAVTVIKHVDQQRGIVTNVPHLRPWENAPVVLPEGSRLANPPAAELPRDTMETLNTKIGLVCSVMGIPMEFLLGQARGSRVTTSTFAEEQLQSTVKSMRKFLEDAMVQMYWRIYWESHAKDALNLVSSVDHVMTHDEIETMLNSIEVKFTFRSERIPYEQARQLFADGVLNGDALKRIAMQRFCLKSSDMEKGVPTAGREQFILAAMNAAVTSSTEENSGKRQRTDVTESASSRVDSGKDVGFEGTEHGAGKKRKTEGDAVAAVNR